jgi:hypothetical protein
MVEAKLKESLKPGGMAGGLGARCHQATTVEFRSTMSIKRVSGPNDLAGND